jgi:hypothetical protein
MCRYRCTDGAFVVSTVSATWVSGAVDISVSGRVDSIAITATTLKSKAKCATWRVARGKRLGAGGGEQEENQDQVYSGTTVRGGEGKGYGKCRIAVSETMSD